MRNMEIGSIYEINSESFAGACREDAERLALNGTKKYGKKNVRYTASGREAIALALKSLEAVRPGIAKKCLLPAYMCDTVFFPFERAGWELHFYHIEKKNLAADEENLREQVEHIRPGLLFVHPYYGVDTWKPMRSLLKEWRAQGICIMEDVTQSYYLEDAGGEADYVVGSLRKWYPVPDGGFVASDEEIDGEKLPENREFTDKRLELLTEKWQYLYEEGSGEEKQALKADYLQKNRKMEEWLDDFAGIGGISAESGKILSAAEEETYACQRNCNYKYLLPKLSGKMKFIPVLSEMTEDAVPLYLPVYAQNQEEMQGYLGQHGIYAPVLWPIGKENEDYLTEEESYIFEHLLALPIDQRYGIEEMEYIAKTLEEYEGAEPEKQQQSVEQVLDPQKSHSIQHATSEIIGIRVDANDIVATGHVMRCVTIAKQFLKKGKRILFLTADEYPQSISNLSALLELPEVELVCLHTMWNRMEEEVPRLKKELKRAGCHKLLVDSYQVTEAYFEQLKDACKIIYIDDCFEGIYPVDMIINYNAYHVRFPYEESYRGKESNGKASKTQTKLLLGTAYVPLREEFRKENFDASGREEGQECVTGSVGEPHVLLSSGGGDVYNALGGILQGIAADHKWDDVIFHVVVGGFNRNGEELKKLAAEHENIKLHHNVTNMAELMNQCHAAVSAAGTMLFELSAMQVPTVFFVSADNQQYDSEFFAAEERMLFAGDIRADREECLSKIENQLFGILADRDMQVGMKKKLHEVVDGNGAARIAEAIVAL